MNATELIIHDTDPTAPQRFVTEQLARLESSRRANRIITVTPVEPVYRNRVLKAVRARVGLFMAVLPISRIDKSAVNIDLMCGKPLPVVIERLPTDKSDLLLNHKIALTCLRGRLFRQLRTDNRLIHGRVRNIGLRKETQTEFGLFVDLGYGLCGVVHVSSLDESLLPLSMNFAVGDSVVVQPVKIGLKPDGQPRIDLRLQ